MSATELLERLFDAGVVVSIVATVLSLGMGLTLPQVVAPLRRGWLVATVVLLNVVVVPGAAWAVTEAFPMKDSYAAGITLTAIAGGGAAGLKAAQLSKRADLALAVGLVMVLQLVDMAAVPVWAGRLVDGATISAGTILRVLLALVLVPLAVGLAVRARYAGIAARWQPRLVSLGTVALGIAVAAGIASNRTTIAALFSSWVLVASIVIVLLVLGLGFLAGGPNSETRATTALITTMRFDSLGLVIIGTQLHGNHDYLGPAICFSLINIVIVMIAAWLIGRRAPATTGDAALLVSR